MSAGHEPSPEQRSAEQRAEALMERVTADVSRWLGRAVGRAREEMEDLVAEARSLNHRDEDTTPPA